MNSDQDRQRAPIWRADEDGTPSPFKWDGPPGETKDEESARMLGSPRSPFTTATLTCCLFLFSLGLGAGLRGESSPQLALPSFTETGDDEDPPRVVLETEAQTPDDEKRAKRIKLAVKPRSTDATSAPDAATVKGLVISRTSSAPAAPAARPLQRTEGDGTRRNEPDAAPGDGLPEVPPITDLPEKEPPSEPVEPEKPESPPPPGDETDEVDEEPDDTEVPDEVEEPVIDGPGNSENAPGHNKDDSQGKGRGPK